MGVPPQFNLSESQHCKASDLQIRLFIVCSSGAYHFQFEIVLANLHRFKLYSCLTQTLPNWCCRKMDKLPSYNSL